MLARERRIRRNRVRLAAGLAIVAAVATVAVVAASGDDDDRKAGAVKATSTTSTSAPPASTSVTAAPETTAPVPAGDPAAPWRTGSIPRSDVPEDVLSAWERAKNKNECGLLMPSDLGARMDGAGSNASSINQDAGWEMSFRKGPAVLQIQGLFEKATRTARTEKEIFSRRWADGSLARYGPDARDEERPADPETSANEATLILPDQSCAYVIYDTQGKTHLEYILEHLQFVAGTE